jgi:hypothetical protein
MLVGAIPPDCASYAATAVSTLRASVLQAETAACALTPPRAKTTTAERTPKMTTTMRSSINVNPVVEQSRGRGLWCLAYTYIRLCVHVR